MSLASKIKYKVQPVSKRWHNGPREAAWRKAQSPIGRQGGAASTGMADRKKASAHENAPVSNHQGVDSCDATRRE